MTERPRVALVVREPWARLIVDGSKRWELRGCRCLKHIGKRVAIARAGSGTLVGEVTIAECLDVTDTWQLPENDSYHRVVDHQQITYQRVYAWVLEDASAYIEPKVYARQKGSITWVTLLPESGAR